MSRYRIIYLSTFLAILFIITGCSSQPNTQIQPATAKSELNYNEVYKRITAAGQKCYPGSILDHDIYDYKPFAQVTINTHPSSMMGFLPVPGGFLMGSYEFESKKTLDIKINGLPDNSSTVTIDNGVYMPVIQGWLSGQYSCNK